MTGLFTAEFGEEAARRGYRPLLTFHPGSQTRDPQTYVRHIEAAARIAAAAGITLSKLNVGGGFPADYPNSKGGPMQNGEPLYKPLEIHGVAGAQAQEKHKDDTDFVQAGALYRVMPEDARERLVANLAGSFAQVRDQAVIDRWLGPDHRYFKVLGEDGGVYILRHDVQRWAWELVSYRPGG